MINTLKNTIVLISFILCFTSCDKGFQSEEDSQPEEDKKNYRYYLDYSEYKYYSRDGELEQTFVIDYEYNGHKMLSSTTILKYETTGVVMTTYQKYEYSGLTCKCLTFYKTQLSQAEAHESSQESTIEYLDDTYRHIRRSTTSRDGHIIEDIENAYNGKCITQSKWQSYDYHNGEIVPSQSYIITYVTNGLYQVGERRHFDDNGNLTNVYSIKNTYLNEEYWDYTEQLMKDDSGEYNVRQVYNYDDSNRLIEYRRYHDEKLYEQQIYVHDGDNCTVSGFAGDLTIEGVGRYIKVPY